jgi:perosamine synthetase
MIPIYTPRISTESVKDALESGWISSQGPYIEKARALLASILQVPYVVLMNNGTSATHMLLKALKYKHPDVSTVYAPNNVFVAVWNTILYEYPGDSMKILEMDPETLNMRTDESYIRSLDHGAAVMIVHNVGNIINVPRLKRLRPDLIFIEDNCEGLFGKYEGVYSGTSPSSLCSAVSFFANKTITCGEGGAFFTHDKELYDYIYKSVHHGAAGERYVYNVIGYNYRMTNIQAALLYDQLLQVEKVRADKHKIFEEYSRRLKDYIVVPVSDADTTPSEWMFVCGVNADYSKLFEHMITNGVDIRPFFYDIGRHAHLSNVKHLILNLSRSFVMLPSYPDLTEQQIHTICSTIIHYLQTNTTSFGTN